MYPEYNQKDPDNPNYSEDRAYPAHPDREYGWEKLFSEHLYLAFQRNYGIEVRVVRYHNIFGPEGIWSRGRERPLRPYAAKWPGPTRVEKSKFGATASKPGSSMICPPKLIHMLS